MFIAYYLVIYLFIYLQYAIILPRLLSKICRMMVFAGSEL